MTKPEFSVVTFLWKPPPWYRSQFNAGHVNILARMVARHFPIPHRMICVTDMPDGIDPSIEVIPLWSDFSAIENPYGKTNPSCYRRLKVFSVEAEAMFGNRFVCLDLDVVVVNDLRPLWLRGEDFVIWGDTNPTTPYNGSMMLLTAGARSKVWTEFDPVRSPKITREAGLFGSDQAWIGHCLGPDEKKWTRRDGVYSFRNEIGIHGRELPPNARIIMAHGQIDPWSPEMQRLPWCPANYR